VLPAAPVWFEPPPDEEQAAMIRKTRKRKIAAVTGGTDELRLARLREQRVEVESIRVLLVDGPTSVGRRGARPCLPVQRSRRDDSAQIVGMSTS
jgi:hypothetical protein